ncbi:unnamed protein product, partial [Chrysoparadoxa australica]
VNKVLLIGLFGGAIYLGTRLLGAKRLSEKSIVRTLNPPIAKITFSGITVATDVVVDNPTNSSVQITKPVIKISSNGNYLASSIPEKGVINIAPIGQTSLGTVTVDIPWSALTPFISGLISRIPGLVSKNNLDSNSLGIPMEYSYSLYVNNLFYESAPTKLL